MFKVSKHKIHNKKEIQENTRINWANVMMFFRFALIPFIIALMLSDNFTYSHYYALVLYSIACITDFFDGRWARKHNMVTDLGRVLDPIADKVAVLVIILLLAKTKFGALEIALSSLIIFREVFVSGIREFMEGIGKTIHVSKLAKWKTTIQMVATGALLLGNPMAKETFSMPNILADFYTLGQVLLVLATYLTVLTGWQYFKGSIKYMK